MLLNNHLHLKQSHLKKRILKICIWCNKSEKTVSFEKKAHIVPKALGGDLLCPNVCDWCNAYFGSQQNGNPSIDLVFKETFNITRTRLLGNKEIGKNKPLSRFKSVYFNLDFKKGKIDVKPTFKLRRGFQSRLCRQFKKGLYKVFLEETERIYNTGLLDKFDFIREFVRYDIGDYPVLYFPRKVPFILLKEKEAYNPQFILDKKFNFFIQDYGFYEIEFLGHLFGFPIIRNFELGIDKYLVESVKQKVKFYNRPVLLKYLTQIDLSLSIMDKK